ncbi:MAG: hypothetical protein ACREFE_15295 [Limisphaerales bacterium]
MRDRSEQILRITCLTFAALVLLQLVRAGFHVSQFAGVKIPAVPTLEIKTNSIAGSTVKLKTQPTNLPAIAAAKIKTSISTHISTNSEAVQTSMETNLVATNAVAQIATNNNLIAKPNPVVAGAIKISKKHLPHSMAMADGMSFSGFPMMPGMSSAPKLPPEIQARVDKIVNSGIFGPVIHPLPMGLLGIAGDTAFLRTASGQTGMVKVGDSLGDLKLLQIGINRVLVEQDGEKKELTIFDGYGGESLLSKTNEILK